MQGSKDSHRSGTKKRLLSMRMRATAVHVINTRQTRALPTKLRARPSILSPPTFSPPSLRRSKLSLLYGVSQPPRPERTPPSSAVTTIICSFSLQGTTAVTHERNGRLLRPFSRRHHPGQAKPGSWREGQGPRPRARDQGKERRSLQETSRLHARRRYLFSTSWWLM